MSKYMLKRGEKRQPLVGHRTISRNGRDVRENVDVVFEPGRAMDSDELDVSLKHWTGKGPLVEIRSIENDALEAAMEQVPPPPSKVSVDDGDVGQDVDNDGDDDGDAVANEVDTGIEADPGSEVDGEDDGDIDESSESESDDNVGDDTGDDYEKLEDGSFKCLHCGKILKTEGGMIKHIEATHYNSR